MSRKLLIITGFTIIAIALIAGLYYRLSNRNSNSVGESNKLPLINIESLKATPIDAVALCCFTEQAGLINLANSGYSNFKNYIDKNSAVFSFMGKILSETQDVAPVISLHYSAKNDLSLLITILLPEDSEVLKKNIWGVNGHNFLKREFSGAQIFESDELSYTYFKGFLIFSSSKILLESSVRHLATSTSVLDNSDFRSVIEKSLYKKNLFVFNNSQSGKLFSGLLSKNLLDYSDFVMNFCSWVVLEGDINRRKSLFTGELYNNKGVGNFSSIFKNVESGSFDAPEILPNNTIALISLSVDNDEKYLSNEQKYLSYYKKLDSVDFFKKRDLFIKGNKGEIVSALIPVGDKNEWITVIKSKKKINFKESSSREIVGSLFGEIFAQQSGDYIHTIDRWTIFGSEEAINCIVNKYQSDSTLKVFLKEKKINTEIKYSGALISVIINSSLENDILPLILNDRVSKSIYGKRVVARDNESVVLQIFPGDEQLKMALTFISRK